MPYGRTRPTIGRHEVVEGERRRRFGFPEEGSLTVAVEREDRVNPVCRRRGVDGVADLVNPDRFLRQEGLQVDGAHVRVLLARSGCYQAYFLKKAHSSSVALG